MKWLVVEEPYKQPEYYPWGIATGTIQKFGFDREDIQELQKGNTVFRVGTAFSLEEQDA